MRGFYFLELKMCGILGFCFFLAFLHFTVGHSTLHQENSTGTVSSSTQENRTTLPENTAHTSLDHSAATVLTPATSPPTAPSTALFTTTSTESSTTAPPTLQHTVSSIFPSPALTLSSDQLPPLISSTKAVSVDCRPSSIDVSVARDFLNLKHISESALYLGQPQCGQRVGNSSHVQLSVGWDECGVWIFPDNTQNTTVQVMLYSNLSSWVAPGIAPMAQLKVPIICRFNNSTGYETPGFLDTISNVAPGSGMFYETVRMLNGTTPLPQDYPLTPKGEVIIEVAVSSMNPQIKVVINKCWANPSKNPRVQPQIIFLENSCPVLNSYTSVIENGESTRPKLMVNVFCLVNFDMIYIHCQIQTCIEMPSATCKPSCVAGSPRESNVLGMTTISCGPLLKQHQESPQEKRRLACFIVLGVGLFLLLMVAMGMRWCYRHRMANYSFHIKPRKENFTYHIFDT